MLDSICLALSQNEPVYWLRSKTPNSGVMGSGQKKQESRRSLLAVIILMLLAMVFLGSLERKNDGGVIKQVIRKLAGELADKASVEIDGRVDLTLNEPF